MQNEQVPVSILKLHNVLVDKITYKRKESYDSEDILKFTFSNSVVRSKDLTTYKVSISTEIFNENRDIYIQVIMSGYFGFEIEEEVPEEFKSEVIEKNTLAILFPYVRSFVTTITSQSGLKPVILPPLNFIALIDQRKESRKEIETPAKELMQSTE